MKKKIRIKEKGKTDVIKEIVVRDEQHLKAQQKYRAQIHQDQTKIIPRKRKYKKFGLDDFFL